MSKNTVTNSSCGFIFFNPSSSLKEEIGILQQVGPQQMSWTCPLQIHIRRSLRLLSNQSCPHGRMFCITLVRKDPAGPNRCEFLFFHGSVLTKCIHKITKEAMHLPHCRSKLDRNRPSLQNLVLHLLVPIEMPANSQFESTLASSQVSLPRYSSQQHESYNST